VAAANSQRGPTGFAGFEPSSFIAKLPRMDGAERARRLQESVAVQMLVDVGTMKRSVQYKVANIYKQIVLEGKNKKKIIPTKKAGAPIGNK
jgi:hypothetical protein